MITKQLTRFALCALGVLAFTSCLDKPFEDLRSEYYARNFIKTFGLIDPEQDWNMAKEREISLNLGPQRAYSVKIYGELEGKYYLCADLTNVKGSFKVPVDLPGSTDDILVVVDNRNYMGKIGSVIDCTGAQAAVTRADGDAHTTPLLNQGNKSATIANSDVYNPATWKHTTNGYLNQSITVGTATGNVKVTETNGDALRADNREEAIYSCDNAYQLINAQQVAALVSDGEWDPEYYAYGKGWYSGYNGDHSIGLVPEGGIGGVKDGTNKGQNNSIGNQGNPGISESITFELESNKFTVYPMFYGTNLQHILGFYLLDDAGLPVVDSNGDVLKFPIYKTKLDDDMLVKDYTGAPASFVINQASNGYVSVPQGTSHKKTLTITLKDASGSDLVETIDYNKVTIKNQNSEFFTLTPTSGGIELEGKKECAGKTATIIYDGLKYTLTVDVEGANTIYSVQLVGTRDNNGNADLYYGGEPQVYTVKYMNLDGTELTGLSDSQISNAFNNIEWTEWTSDETDNNRKLYKVEKDAVNKRIIVTALNTSVNQKREEDQTAQPYSSQWTRFYLAGKYDGNDTNTYDSINFNVIPVKLGLVRENGTNWEKVGNVTLGVGGEAATLKLVNILSESGSTVTVDNLPTSVLNKVTFSPATSSYCTITRSGDTVTITPTAEGNGNFVATLGSGFETANFGIYVSVTDPNKLDGIKVCDSQGVEVTELTLAPNETAHLYVKAVRNGNPSNDSLSDTDYNNLGFTDNGNLTSVFGRGKNTSDREIIVTAGTTLGNGNITVSYNQSIYVNLSLSVVDPNQIKSISLEYVSGGALDNGAYYAEPYDEGDIRIRIVGTTVSNSSVSWTLTTLQALSIGAEYYGDGWSNPAKLSDWFTLEYDEAEIGVVILKYKADKDGSNTPIRLVVSDTNNSGNKWTSTFNLGSGWCPNHKVWKISINNANVTYYGESWGQLTLKTGFVVKDGNNIPIDISYNSQTDGNGVNIDPSIAKYQVDFNIDDTSIVEGSLNDNGYYYLKGKSVGETKVKVQSKDYNYINAEINVLVISSESEQEESVAPTIPNSAPKKDVVQRQNYNSEVEHLALCQYPPRNLKKVHFITEKERTALRDRSTKNSTRRSYAPKSRAADPIPSRLTYDSNTKWNDIQKVWEKTKEIEHDDGNGDKWTEYVGTVNSFDPNVQQLVRVKGFDVIIDQNLPHSSVGFYIDVLAPDYISSDKKSDYYYTALQQKGDGSYPGLDETNPYPFTHFSQRMLNIHNATEYEANHGIGITSGSTQFAYSYACSFKHPLSNRTFFAFEDWPIKHAAADEKSIDGNASGFDYSETPFWKGDSRTGKEYSSDRDLNDLVFVIYGAKAVKGTNPFVVETSEELSWLWAVEDLGSTDDFDFNDLVMKVTSLTLNVTKPESDDSGDDDAPEFYKKITFQPLCAGGTLPLYIHYGSSYVLRFGTFVGEHIKTLFENAPEGTVVPYDQSSADDLTSLLTQTTDSEIHRWFGVKNSHTMINTGLNSTKYVGRPCVLYISGDDYEALSPGSGSGSGLSLQDFGRLTIKDFSSGNNNAAGLYVHVDDGRANQYDSGDYDGAIYDNITTGWLVTPPEKGKVSQMFMIPDNGWRWPYERTHILEAYPTFKDWVGGNKYGFDWYSPSKLTESQREMTIAR